MISDMFYTTSLCQWKQNTGFPVVLRYAQHTKKERNREIEINKYSLEQSSSLDIGKHSINQYNGEYKACLQWYAALKQVAEDL